MAMRSPTYYGQQSFQPPPMMDFGFGGGGSSRMVQPGSRRRAALTPGGMPGAGPSFQNSPQMPYQPQGPQVQGLIDPLASTAKGLMDPSSDYHKRMRTELMEGIGGQTEAQKRAAALRAARSGLGVGASPELMETESELGRTGQEAMSDASTQAMLGGIGMGGQMMSPAISGQLGLQGQQMQGYLAQQAASQDQEMARFQAAMQQQQLAQDAMMRQLAMYYGLF